MKKINIALVGLSFGGAFIPIYRDHPNVDEVILCDINKDLLNKASKRFGIEKTASSLEEILDDENIDAVHLITPIFSHAKQTIKVLKAKKHCACTVPMATSVEDIKKIIRTVKSTGKKYMMMETSVYTREFLYVKKIINEGAIGRIQYLKGAHLQDMEYWPDYWKGLPPMWYSTHAVSPIIALSGRPIKSTCCIGSGKMRDELREKYNNPYPIETAVFEIGESLSCEVTRSLFETAVMYRESFSVYGSKASFEWQQMEDEDPVVIHKGERNIDENGIVWRGSKMQIKRIKVNNFDYLLPSEIRKYTVKNKYYDEKNPQESFEAGGGHGGSHPHLVDEFVSSIIEDRKPEVDEIKASWFTLPGLCAHESAMKKGAKIEVPNFEKI